MNNGRQSATVCGIDRIAANALVRAQMTRHRGAKVTDRLDLQPAMN